MQDYRATKRPSIYLGHLDSGSLQNHFKMDFPERLIFDGMNIPPFRPLKENVEKRFTEIRNLECRKDDIILATYNKSGNLSVLVLYNTMETTYMWTICFIILIESAIGRELEYDWVDGGACADLKRGGLDPNPRQTPANYPSDPLPLKKNLDTRIGGGGGNNTLRRSYQIHLD